MKRTGPSSSQRHSGFQMVGADGIQLPQTSESDLGLPSQEAKAAMPSWVDHPILQQTSDDGSHQAYLHHIPHQHSPGGSIQHNTGRESQMEPISWQDLLNEGIFDFEKTEFPKSPSALNTETPTLQQVHQRPRSPEEIDGANRHQHLGRRGSGRHGD